MLHQTQCNHPTHHLPRASTAEEGLNEGMLCYSVYDTACNYLPSYSFRSSLAIPFAVKKRLFEVLVLLLLLHLLVVVNTHASCLVALFITVQMKVYMYT